MDPSLHTNWAEAAALYSTFARVWGKGGEASLHLKTQGGQLKAELSLSLGPPTHLRPGAPAPPPLFPHPHPPHPHPQHPQPVRDPRQPRHRGPATRRRDQARLAAWRERRQGAAEAATALAVTATLASSTTTTTSSSTPITSSTSDSQVPTSPLNLSSSQPLFSTSDSPAVPTSSTLEPVVPPTSALAYSPYHTPSVMVTTVGAPATDTVARRANKSTAVVLDPPDPLPQLDGEHHPVHQHSDHDPDPWARTCIHCGDYPVELDHEGICASCNSS